MLFDIPYIADWNKIGDYRQRQTDLNTKRENNSRIDYDYKVDGKVLVRKDGILRKTESRYDSEPWTITSVHTNGTIRVKRGSKSERLTAEPLWTEISVHFFLGLRKFVITSRIFVLKASWRHQNLAEIFSYNRGVLLLHTACRVDDLSRGSISYYENHYFY
jgi:hypothetical protein